MENYKKVWKYHYQKRSYHLLLKDLSFFRFHYIDDNVNFEYLHCPFNLKEIFLEIEDPEEIVPTPIRYDYNPQSFSPIVHPVGHIHIGIKNSIRIGTHCQFNPLSFLLFCLRQMYPDYWKIILENVNFTKCQKHIRKKIDKIENKYKEAFEREHIIT